MSEATMEPVRFPPAVRVPRFIQGLAFVGARHRSVELLSRRYGSIFTLNLPRFLPISGPTLVISDPALIKDLFTMNTDLVRILPVLGVVGGPGSTFSLVGDEHRERRKLLAPSFHGKRMHSYERVVEEEVMHEIADWPEDQEFPTLEPMLRVSLNVILRAIFGAEGAAFDELHKLLPLALKLLSMIGVLPAAVKRDLGPWSPWGRFQRCRRRYDEIIDSLIAEAQRDPAFNERTDVLSLMLQARYANGAPISHRHVADELFALLAAGHVNTAVTVAWTIERLRRHPRLLSRLTAEADAGGSELLQATIWEVQRTRTVVDGTARLTRKRIRLGEWVVPANHFIWVGSSHVHASSTNFPDAEEFDPDRFVGNPPDWHTWIPYGGGVNRCLGAPFANVEIIVTLRTLLREFEFGATDAPGEPTQVRGVATAPRRGGLAVVYRRSTGTLSRAADHEQKMSPSLRPSTTP